MRLTFFMKVRVKITLGSLVVFLCGLYFPKEKKRWKSLNRQD